MYNTRENTKRENFNPQVDWIEDHNSYILVIQLPGFTREEIRVQHNRAGKLFVKGSRLATDNKYIDVDQSFDVPKDVITEQISGQFEDGLLLLTMPKNAIAEAEGEVVAKEKTLSEEAIKKEKLKQEATKRAELKQEEKHEQGKVDNEKKDGDVKQRKKAPTQEKEKESAVEDVENQKTKTESINRQEGKRFEQAVEDIKENNNEKVNATSTKEKRKKTMQKMKMKMHGIYKDTPEEIRRKINKITGGEVGWLNNKYTDSAVEKINRNRNIIAVAVMAFSVGLYVSHKLKSRSG